MITETNAVIKSTSLGYSGHGIFSCWLHLDYSGSGQGFGGYALDTPAKIDGKHSYRKGTEYGMEFIRRIMKAVDVQTWEELPGTHVRVMAKHNSVIAITHILKDQWFYPARLKNELLENIT